MPTTVDLPDDLLAEAKTRAAREGRSLSAVVGDALRHSFSRLETAERGPVDVPTFRGGGPHAGVDLDDTSALLDVMECGG